MGSSSGINEQEVCSLDSPFAVTIHPDLYLKPNILGKVKTSMYY